MTEPPPQITRPRSIWSAAKMTRPRFVPVQPSTAQTSTFAKAARVPHFIVNIHSSRGSLSLHFIYIYIYIYIQSTFDEMIPRSFHEQHFTNTRPILCNEHWFSNLVIKIKYFRHKATRLPKLIMMSLNVTRKASRRDYESNALILEVQVIISHANNDRWTFVTASITTRRQIFDASTSAAEEEIMIKVRAMRPIY